MKRQLITSLLLLLPFLLFAQKSEEVIQSIRDRYYRINNGSVKLTKVSLQGTDYYLENDKLSIAKKKTQTGKYEYYFDSSNEDYYAYFIYFEPNDPADSYLRAYYDDNTELVLFKEGEVDTTYGAYENYPFKYLKQDARNAINLFFNAPVLIKYSNDIRVDRILTEVAQINQSIMSTDTIRFYEEGEGTGGKFHYLNARHVPVKISTFDGGEHGGGILNEYYMGGQLIYSIDEHESWLGFYSRITVSVKFYENNVPFREEYFDRESPGEVYSRSNDGYFLEWYELDNVIPTIKYKD